MATRRYLNFDLLLEQEGEGRYQARVTDSPLGETPSVHFALPFDATTLENLLLKLDPGRTGTRRVGSNPMQQAAMDFGGPLYQAIFTGDLGVAWTRSLDRVRSENAGGLRLRLRLNDAPAIAGLPWELLYDARSNSFIAQSERTPLVRFLDVPEVPKPMAVDGPLRVLAIISSPTDLDELDVEAEWNRLSDALAPRLSAGLVVLDRLPSPTLSELGTWLRRSETHVVHFVGHGDFDEGLREGVIYFQDETGRRSPVTASTLGPYLRDHDPLRMVVLNACRSARTDSVDPFGGMAQGLVQQDASAVVAMQFPISDKAAVKFTGEFYGALVDGLPVDQAVSSARKALLDGFRDEWATPVLFLRAPDGNIFENVHAAAGAVPTAEQTPGPTPPGPGSSGGEPVPPVPPPPGTSAQPEEASPLAWVRSHLAVVLSAVAAVVVLVVLAVVVLPLGGDEPPPEEPVDNGLVDLPRSSALPGTQMLVAAGATPSKMRLWLVDVGNSTLSHEVTVGTRNEWLPVLGPGRDSVIYSRQELNSNDDYQLRVAAAGTGDDPQALFDPPPQQCSRHSGRPAWAQPGGPESAFLVMRCVDDVDNRLSLVKVDATGKAQTLDVLDANGEPWARFGDPTLSPDGSMVVLWVTNDPKAEAGSLYAITLADGTSHPLLDEARPREFSDPVFSPVRDDQIIAFRRAVEAPQDPNDPTGPTKTSFDIFTARIDDNLQAVDVTSLVGTSASEEDPTFSPDGTRIAFTSTLGGRATLTMVDTTPGSAPVPVPVPTDFPVVVKVPSWSNR